jgi:hypothetical protein
MKKLGIIALALIVALGALGVGYAHWSQTLYIHGTVNTGKYCVGFLKAGSDDPCVSECNPGVIGPNPGPGEGTIDPGSDPPKNVACANATVGVLKDCCEEGKLAYEYLYILVCNAYPCYTANVSFTLKNCGTIPGDILALTITELNGTPVTPIELVSGVMTDVDIDDDGETDMEVTYYPAADPQVDPCNTADYNLIMHFVDGIDDVTGLPIGLSEDTTYTFKMELETVQWNLAPSP